MSHPAGSSALARHDRMVREEMLQAERVRTTASRPVDCWQTLAPRFRLPGDRGPEPTVQALAALVGPRDRAIDVGAGGGRLAIALAQRCREVVAVEPSPSMRAVLAEEVARHGAANVHVVPATWEEAVVQPAELVFSAHVTYGVQAIEPFLRKLDATATHHAALVVLRDPPLTPLAPFWQAVHGEERLRLPCRDELVAAIGQLGIAPAVTSLGEAPPMGLGSREDAIELLRFRLVVGPGTPADVRLLAALDRLTEERGGELYPRDVPANEVFLLRWTPGHRGSSQRRV